MTSHLPQRVSSELSSALKKQSHELTQQVQPILSSSVYKYPIQTKKYSELRHTLDCTWSIIQKVTGPLLSSPPHLPLQTGPGSYSSLLKLLDSECQLSRSPLQCLLLRPHPSCCSRAHLLVAVNDEAVLTQRHRKNMTDIPPPPAHPPPYPPPAHPPPGRGGRGEESRGGQGGGGRHRHTHGEAGRGGQGRQHWLLG